ncbi:MAG: aminopeptidase P family protein [Candidatus Heimdallarchaeota archaeon]|nr:aminopeptidase P family protein [Candidatus Heimdallarchaeota archaeon]
MNESPPLFAKAEFRKRYNTLKSKLKDLSLSIIFSRADLTYYSGIGMDGVLILADELHHYVRRNLPLAEMESELPVSEMASFRLFKTIAKNLKIESIGLELDIVPYKTIKYIENAFGNPEIKDISPALRQIRSVKSEEEIKLMEKACKQTDESFEYIQDKIKPGVTELDLSAEIDHFLRRQGHPGFVQIRNFQHNYTTNGYVMAGESTITLNSMFGPVSGQGLSKMHKNGPSRRKIRDHDAVLIDTTGVWEGYTADETRTFFVGNVDPNLEEAYEVAKQVQNHVKKNLVESKNPKDLYFELNELVTELGYFESFMGPKNDKVAFIGHGVGLELDEFPIITSGYDTPLVSGQLVAMEPKFIFPALKSGVGIEDTWVVGKNQARRLTQFPW